MQKKQGWKLLKLPALMITGLQKHIFYWEIFICSKKIILMQKQLIKV